MIKIRKSVTGRPINAVLIAAIAADRAKKIIKVVVSLNEYMLRLNSPDRTV